MIKKLFGNLSPARLAYLRTKNALIASMAGFPARDMKVICITGTDGKSTTSLMTTYILEEADFSVGMAGSLDYRINGETIENKGKMTTSGAGGLNKTLIQMKKAGVTHLVLETSSHSLVQNRLAGIRPHTSVWTNLTREHLDYHGTMEHYRASKGLLFDRTTNAMVLNRDSEHYSYYSQFPVPNEYDFSFDGDASVRAHDVSLATTGTTFTLEVYGEKVAVDLKVPGKVNVLNALAAAAAAHSVGVSLDVIARGLGKVDRVPGRMQMVREGQLFDVMIDYAVTPASLTTLYETLSEMVHGKIIHVFGSCGDRDKGKRPIMGKIVGNRANICIVTNEDPYTENPRAIMDMVYEGVKGAGKVDEENAFLIEDRTEAIEKAIELAHEGDLVVLTGKGSETSIQWADKKTPWSEEETVRTILRRRKN